MRYRCVSCSNNCYIPGKVRGSKIRNFTCPCGGALGRGANADGESVPAVPLKISERPAPDARRGVIK